MTLGTVACQAPLSMWFSKQWRGLPRPSPGDLPDQWSNLRLSVSCPGRQVLPASAAREALQARRDELSLSAAVMSLSLYIYCSFPFIVWCLIHWHIHFPDRALLHIILVIIIKCLPPHNASPELSWLTVLSQPQSCPPRLCPCVYSLASQHLCFGTTLCLLFLASRLFKYNF